ncbi:adenylate/guanylate cyclase domain-containing protein [Bradyrhizobium sp.]|uniref:adenylate/guanylate cyclase domain-containing protein n=1 Tax=Bradyrhizobium sp. TaxID=376 RepID=UPI000AC12935|nr:adenylate/guanylate cyclase domain-containing protein [Bradyrhizobium sp.]
MNADDLPETRFARSGSVSIAYQVMGDGPIDLVLIPGMVSHVEMMHEIPGYTAFLRRLASFARVTTFDKRGQGLSDRFEGAPTLEERSDDVRAVMDAVGIDRAALLAISEGTMMAAYFGATFPDRVSHLVLYGGMPRQSRTPDFSIGFPPEAVTMFRNWGSGSFITKYASPSWQHNPELVKLGAKFERLSCSPGNLRALVTMNATMDVRHILPGIRTPTLVLHRQSDALAPIALGRYYAEHIPGARFIVYPSGEHWPPTVHDDWTTICEDIEEFVTGTRRAQDTETERILATVMFTDIVESTQRAVSLGDAVWRERLDEHDRIARRVVEQHRGRLIKSTGDGLLATFDGPGRAIRCATAIKRALAALNLPVRVGLHTGEIEQRGSDISGIAVHTAARVAENASAGEVLVSSIVVDLVAGSDISFVDRGQFALQGVPGTWRLMSVTP